MNKLSKYLSLALVALCSATQAATVTLTDNGSSAFINLDSDSGMSSWTVTGLPVGMENQLNQQWFWYRIGNGVPQPINAISSASYVVSPAGNQVTSTYVNSDVSVQIKYTLTGGGLGQADIAEGIILQNLHPETPLDFHFYQYSDFNLLNSAGGDTVWLDNRNVVQWRGETQLAESIIAPDANHFEANTTDGSPSTLWKLKNTADLVLNDSSYAQGDVTWAYQWDFLGLTTGTIQKDKLVDVTFVPEPSVLALMGVGMTVLALRRRAKV